MILTDLFVSPPKKTVILQAEVNYLGQLSHPNLVKLIGYCFEDEQRLLVYEFMPRGSLEHHLFRSKQSTTFLCHVHHMFSFFVCVGMKDWQCLCMVLQGDHTSSLSHGICG